MSRQTPEQPNQTNANEILDLRDRISAGKPPRGPAMPLVVILSILVGFGLTVFVWLLVGQGERTAAPAKVVPPKARAEQAEAQAPPATAFLKYEVEAGANLS